MITVDPGFVKELAELVDGDSWQVADLLVAAFPADEWGEGKSGISSGIYAALASYEVALRDDYGVELKANTMRNYRSTALAWPSDMRVSLASFEAHKLLRGDDRFGRMQSYLSHNHGHALSVKVVRRMNADNKPRPPLKPWEVKVAKRLESTARSLLLGAVITKRDDWWRADVVTDEARAVVARALHDLANRITS